MNGTAAATDTPLVDTHFHLYTRDMPITPWAWHNPPEDASAEQFIEVISGLQPEEPVVAEPPGAVEPGARVRSRPRDLSGG